ncbi:uncharacterized protein LOC118741812 [Rhagoletis pomonella]|uniref:uncharacterized protein LOC118741812 n=1 Tax=Rhagoletis pomonella TaxID=28610 RepID=UPI001784DD9B|nr:uncharacterized protein LOC118741812 [Rhagoletis pomonella]
MFTLYTSCSANRVKKQKLITLNKIEDTKTLRTLYRQNWPANALGCYTLDNFIKWHERDKQLQHVRIYTLDDGEQWCCNGLHLIVVRFMR